MKSRRRKRSPGANIRSGWKQLNKLAVHISLVALVATIVFNCAMWYGYYSPTLELNQELAQIVKSQAEKKPILILTVYPSGAYSSFRVYHRGQGNFTFTIEKTPLTFGPGSRETFHVFLSNVGTCPTVAQELFIVYDTGRTSGSFWRNLNSTILKPGDSIEWTWTFTVSTDIKEQAHGSIAFAVLTTDGTIGKIVEIIINPPHLA